MSGTRRVLGGPGGPTRGPARTLRATALVPALAASSASRAGVRPADHARAPDNPRAARTRGCRGSRPSRRISAARPGIVQRIRLGLGRRVGLRLGGRLRRRRGRRRRRRQVHRPRAASPVSALAINPAAQCSVQAARVRAAAFASSFCRCRLQGQQHSQRVLRLAHHAGRLRGALQHPWERHHPVARPAAGTPSPGRWRPRTAPARWASAALAAVGGLRDGGVVAVGVVFRCAGDRRRKVAAEGVDELVVGVAGELDAEVGWSGWVWGSMRENIGLVLLTFNVCTADLSLWPAMPQVKACRALAGRCGLSELLGSQPDLRSWPRTAGPLWNEKSG